MAKKSLSDTYKNCEVNLAEMSLIEVSKDSVETFSIMDILKSWDGEDGVDITIKKSSDISASDEDGDEG